MTIYAATLALILVLDPLGNIPVFSSILKNVAPKRRNHILLRETFIAFLILSLFLFFGQYILVSLNLSQAAIGVAGGLILFMIAIRMIFPPETTPTERQNGEPFIVPLAVPLTAGPSAIATVLLFASKDPDRLFSSFIAVSIACTVFAIILLSSRFLIKVLHTSGLIAMERLMGMLLTVVAVQMFLEGISGYFNLH
jgi:multiple antibiotic resistance protein